MNKYDLEHVTTHHKTMSPDEWAAIYRKAYDIYYSPEHIERMFRRAKANGTAVRLVNHVMQFYFTFRRKTAPAAVALLPAQGPNRAALRHAAGEPADLLSAVLGDR